MYNAGLWLVVKPTVGIPIFLGAVAVGSFAVHVAILTNTTWLPQFLNGEEMTGTTAAAEDAKTTAATATPSATARVVQAIESGKVVAGEPTVVVLPDGSTARVVFDPPGETTAAPGTVALAPPAAD